MASPTVADFLARNKASLTSYQPRPLVSEMAALQISQPSTVIVTCSDWRIDPQEAFGLKFGDAAILRNVGGRVKAALQDIAVLDSFFGHGQLKQLFVVHHTDCGGLHFTDASAQADIASRYVSLTCTHPSPGSVTSE